jgi:hypothetical protein
MTGEDEPKVSIDCAAKLDDDELIAILQWLLRKESKHSALLLAHLGELDARQLYRQRAYSSMFEYCVQALHFSEAEAYLRIGAARLCRRFPRALPMFAAGELHLAALKLLAPVLDEANCEKLLAAARFKSKREVEMLVAKLRKQPDVPSLIRKLPQRELVPELAGDPAQPLLLTSTPSRDVQPCSQPSLEREPAPPLPNLATPKPTTLSPLGASRYKVQLTASQQLHDKLRQAQDLLRHELPDGDLVGVIERALDLLIVERLKRRFGQSSKPRKSRNSARAKPGNRHIPNEVRREVLARDCARCAFVSPDRKRCEQRGGLERHHEVPFGRGGLATSDNIRILCRTHNQLLAEHDYGREFMQRRIERARDERGGHQLGPGPVPDPALG